MCLKSIKHHEWLESRVISPVEQSRISYGLTLTCQKTELGVGMRRNSWYFYKGFFQFSASLFTPLEKWKDWFVVWKLQAEGESLGWLWLVSWVCLRICWECCFNPASQLWRVGYLLLLASPVPQLSPDYLQKEMAVWFYLFLFSRRGTKISSLSL